MKKKYSIGYVEKLAGLYSVFLLEQMFDTEEEATIEIDTRIQKGSTSLYIIQAIFVKE